MRRLYRLTLLAAASLIPSASLAQATLPAPPSIKFDVVSFKRCDAIGGPKNTVTTGDSIARHCQPMNALFDYAYGFNGAYKVKGEPEWVDTEAWEFLAKVAPEDVPAWKQTDRIGKGLMIRAMLADVLNLRAHVETQSIPVYNLVVAKGGPKLTESKSDPNDPIDSTGTSSWIGRDEAVYRDATMQFLANGLAARLGHVVVDKTGLKGHYDFHVQPVPLAHYDPKTSDVESTNFAAIIDGVKSLGLKLEPGKADTTVVVVDHIEKPSEN
jgi:uncharacterized protein (TIGR03435 family)